jgi:hypothetical protein
LPAGGGIDSADVDDVEADVDGQASLSPEVVEAESDEPGCVVTGKTP